MDIDRDSLADNYRDKPDEELLSLHVSGTLTKQAYEIVEAELGRRGIPFPQRPDPIAIAEPQSLGDHWHGRATLASAYWLLGVLGGFVVASLAQAFLVFVVAKIPSDLIRLILSIGADLLMQAYFIFVLVAVWRCSRNTAWKGWGYIARYVMLIANLKVFYSLVILLQTV